MRMLLLLLALFALTLAGCGAQDSAESEPAPQAAEKAAPAEPASSEQHHPSLSEAEAADAERLIASYEGGAAVEAVECQMAKLYLDVGEAEAQRVVDGFELYEGPSVEELQAQGMDYPEAMEKVTADMEKGPTLPEYLAEKGYTC